MLKLSRVFFDDSPGRVFQVYSLGSLHAHIGIPLVLRVSNACRCLLMLAAQVLIVEIGNFLCTFGLQIFVAPLLLAKLAMQLKNALQLQETTLSSDSPISAAARA